jgi:predicted alpha/beta superfamily hydrolase
MPNRSDSPDGTVRLHRRFASRVLGNERDLVVWLPPGLDGRKRRHPVVYFQDGQNLFDPRTAFLGQAWHAGKTAAALIRAGELDAPILVGIYNTGFARMDEYAPTRGKFSGGDGEECRSRGLARKYARFVAEEVKPFIDGRYPTRPERAHTAVAGSSMGGLAALYAALWQPRVFGAAAVMSASAWWDNGAPVKFVAALKKKPAVRLWLDTGTAEPGWENTRRLRDALVARGWREGEDLHYLEVPGAEHNEAAWAARAGPMLQWVVDGRM